MADESRSPTPFNGYVTAESESGSDSSDRTVVEPPSEGRKQKKRRFRAVSLPQRDAKGRFLPRAGGNGGGASGNGASGSVDGGGVDLTDDDDVLSQADSLAWDGLLDDTAVRRRWSQDTQRDVLTPDHDLIDEDNLLLPHLDVSWSAASAHPAETGGMAEVITVRARVERALLEVEDDVLPFRGKIVSTARLSNLIATATELKKALQDSHLYLAAHDGEHYDAHLRQQVTDGRRTLAAIIVEMEELYAQQSAVESAAVRQAAAAQAGPSFERVAAKQVFIQTRVHKLIKDTSTLADDCRRFCTAKATSDDQLYERAENHKVLSTRVETALEECKLTLNQALEHDLLEESGIIDEAVGGLRELKQEVDKQMLSSRRVAGVWTEKGRRAVARSDLKAPIFSGSATDKLTIYEFEREWAAYKSAVNFSVEEALKELKLAVQQPARAAVQKMTSEAAISTYLKAHYGNPVLLLSARETEMRALADCTGTDAARREWLIHVKNRLEATVTLCEEHGIQKYLHFSSIAGLVQSKLPTEMVRDFKKVLVTHLSPAGVLEKEIIVDLLIKFIDEKILDCTLGVNLDIVGFLGANSLDGLKLNKSEGQKEAQKQPWRNSGGGNNSGKYNQHSQQQHGGNHGGKPNQQAQLQDPKKCVVCGGEHPALYYCSEFIKARTTERFEMIKAQKSCSRCLFMTRKFSGRKSDWWPTHEKYCKTSFACKEGLCSGKPKERQNHMTVCFTHVTENRMREQEFIKSLDQKYMPVGCTPGNLTFLHMLTHAVAAHPRAGLVCQEDYIDEDGFEIIPDIPEDGLFLMQMLPSEREEDGELLCFYDSGCGSAGMSDRAYDLLGSKTVRPGPTVLDVAGGKSILVPYGEEQFHLEMGDKKQKATITGLRMPKITAEFPLVQLSAAFMEVQVAAVAAGEWDKKLTADPVVGGRCVDIILGIRYLKYYPDLVYSLPSGLAVYKARLKSASGCQAVLGGPHAAWTRAAEQTQHMNPRVYFTKEARAWYVEEKWVSINQDKFGKMVGYMDPEEDIDKPTMVAVLDQQKEFHDCSHCHCEASAGMYSAASQERQLWRVEELGTESPYRCVSCRNCNKCKNGDTLEAISFREEAEQALIEQSVDLEPAKNTLWAKLPFVADPVEMLKPNRFIAEKVLKSQLLMFEKHPGMRQDAVKSHQKLVDRGHVMSESEARMVYKEAMEKVPGDGYFIPWRTVYNDGSISTPCRLVFDASSKTPGGESLNGVLAKGQNRLAKLQHLLVRFRLGAEAVTADISMAYNGTRLRPEHLKFQKYLWKENLCPTSPTEVRVVATLIYGVKPSGQQCQVSLEKLSDFFLEKKQCLAGANALKNSTYVDDIISGQETREECRQVADEISKILAKGSMAVKAFTFSGQQPSEKVSADGTNVGLAGYLWAPKGDHIQLDIGPPRLGKARRGRRPDPVAGEFKTALASCFTKRVLTGLVASVFDPIGLATPITAGLKLDLHELCKLQLDWDDVVPLELLSKWADNMKKIQSLREVVYKRTVIPVDAKELKVELLVATDASQHVGIAAVYGRVLRTNGEYSCQLIAARSKLLTGLTIPKAELKSAVTATVLAHVVRTNLGEKYGGSVYITDSTICLYWITQDDRPLQVGVRNAVSEIRRFSDHQDWHHVATELNVADLGTREATAADLMAGAGWQEGQPWMQLPRQEMPIKSAAQVTLTAEEKRVAATELRAGDLRGHQINVNQGQVGLRYNLSKYLVDPCQHTWSKAVRIVALIERFVARCKAAVEAARVSPERSMVANRRGDGQEDRRAVVLTVEEVRSAENHFFRKATKEVHRFSKPSDYKQCSVEKDGILYFSGRLLNTEGVRAMEEVMFDLSPTSFCRPIVDRHSPVAYSVMLETHWRTVHHLSATTTYRESLSVVYTIKGRDLAQEVRESCAFCKRYKARLLEVEIGKIHETRTVIAPPFTYCQVDLFGPLEATCEHNHRSTVKVWGVVFKDPASGAVFVHAMAKCDTSAFIQAYTRFAARFCHPMKLFPDEGSQLLRACGEMEIDWVDVSHTLNSKHQVGVESSPCPVGGHNFHGQVERSIREIKKLFATVYKGVKLDILSFETAFAWVSNELNNLPTCLGSRYRNLDNLDLITPNRLIQGRSNKRAMSGPCTIDRPSKMLEKMDDIFEAWWQAWNQEKLADFVAKPAKWFRSGAEIRVGDVVIFQKRPDDQQIGSPIWTIGRVITVKVSGGDGKIREVEVEYKNSSEKTWRKTHRAARAVAVLHKEGDLDVVQGLNEAARVADKTFLAREAYVDQQVAVVRNVQKCKDCVEPVLCNQHSLYFAARPYIYPE